MLECLMGITVILGMVVALRLVAKVLPDNVMDKLMRILQ